MPKAPKVDPAVTEALSALGTRLGIDPGKATTRQLMDLLGVVGPECNEADEAAKRLKAIRLEVYKLLADRDVSYRAMGAKACQSDVAIVRALGRAARRMHPPPVV